MPVFLEKGVVGNGTISDMDGKFALTVGSDKSQLEISYIGYQTQQVSVALGKTLAIILQENAKALDEVVVVGLWYTK